MSQDSTKMGRPTPPKGMATYLVVFKSSVSDIGKSNTGSASVDNWTRQAKDSLESLKSDLSKAKLDKQIWAIGEPTAFNSVSVIATKDVGQFLKVHSSVEDVIEDTGNFELYSE